jgi:tRNA C32,U32 (ribose-2'-O)-methylase TrmJ
MQLLNSKGHHSILRNLRRSFYLAHQQVNEFATARGIVTKLSHRRKSKQPGGLNAYYTNQ